MILEHSPQKAPTLNKAVLKAALLVPYPCEYKFPYPQAPSAKEENKIVHTNQFFLIIVVVVICSLVI